VIPVSIIDLLKNVQAYGTFKYHMTLQWGVYSNR